MKPKLNSQELANKAYNRTHIWMTGKLIGRIRRIRRTFLFSTNVSLTKFGGMVFVHLPRMASTYRPT